MRRLMAALALALSAAAPAAAQHLDVTVFAGGAFPLLDGGLDVRVPTPSLPGFDITATGTPELSLDGGTVFGGAVAVEFGILAIEGRLDSTAVGFDLSGARYDFRATRPVYQGLAGSVTIQDGRFDVDRLNLLSLNLRLRTPGRIGLVASGGLSYLPDIHITGSVPVDVELQGLPVLPGIDPRLRLIASPTQSEHRWGVNAGAGLRVGGKVALVAEARFFYFQDYELRFALDQGLPYVDQLAASLESVKFEPVFLNAQAGIAFRFW